MSTQPSRSSSYKVWGADDVIYGPVELPTLVNWIKDDRITPETWIFREDARAWTQAQSFAPLQSFFPIGLLHPEGMDIALAGIDLSCFKQIKILAELENDQIQRLMKYVEVVDAPQFKVVVKQGEPGDAMYLVLEGELRARLLTAGKETILATIGHGDFFGEISLFDDGPRSTDVVSNKDSTLLRLSALSFKALIKDAPDISAPLLFAMGKTLAARIRTDNKRYQDAVHLLRTIG